MTRKEALAELISEVEAGMWPGTNILHKIDDNYGFNAWRAFEGSLDAAKALHEAVLPGWTLNSLHELRHPDNGMPPTGQWACLLFRYSPAVEHVQTKSETPARAWLLSILRALHNMEKD